MKVAKLLLIALVIATAHLAVGCREEYATRWVSVAPGDSRGDVTLYRDVVFDDIPVPQGYYLVPDRSYSFQGANVRNGVFHYQGQVEWTYALEWFRTELPAIGWDLTETERGFSDRVLRFSKGPERLIVVVRQVRNGSWAELQLDNIDKNDLLLKGKLAE